jgi:hypothetical protein
MPDSHELVIRGGTVIDGSGLEPFEADVAIDNGRISAVAPGLPKGREEIAAKGRIVKAGGSCIAQGRAPSLCPQRSVGRWARCRDRGFLAGVAIGGRIAQRCPVLGFHLPDIPQLPTASIPPDLRG